MEVIKLTTFLQKLYQDNIYWHLIDLKPNNC